MKTDTKMEVRVCGRLDCARPKRERRKVEKAINVTFLKGVLERKSAYTERLVAVRCLHCASTACYMYTRLFRLHCAIATIFEKLNGDDDIVKMCIASNVYIVSRRLRTHC